MWRLEDLPAAPYGNYGTLAGISHSGDHIVTAQKREKTVTIIHPHSKTPSQSIDTDTEILSLTVTGHVLLVECSDKTMAWLLTEKGVVKGVPLGQKVNHPKSIWIVEGSTGFTVRKVESQIVEINFNGQTYISYHTGTGKVLKQDPTPQNFISPWTPFMHLLCGQDYLHFYNPLQSNIIPGGNWQTSPATLQEGWVKDHEGKHRLWIPVEWRTSWDCADWVHNINIQFSIIGGKPVIIKF